MDYTQLVDQLTPELIEKFSDAVATGKWEDGRALTEEQRENCIQAIMLYNARHTTGEAEPFSISASGELLLGKKQRAEFQGESTNERLARENEQRIDTIILQESKTKH